MRISDWSSDVCSSDLGLQHLGQPHLLAAFQVRRVAQQQPVGTLDHPARGLVVAQLVGRVHPYPADHLTTVLGDHVEQVVHHARIGAVLRSEEHTSELQSLMRIPYTVVCLKNKPPN